MATNWPSINEIDPCNDDLVVAITEVIISNKFSTKNHLITPVNLFKLNPEQTKSKNYERKRCDPSPSYHRQTPREERRAARASGGV
jgi:hypothetical protein